MTRSSQGHSKVKSGENSLFLLSSLQLCSLEMCTNLDLSNIPKHPQEITGEYRPKDYRGNTPIHQITVMSPLSEMAEMNVFYGFSQVFSRIHVPPRPYTLYCFIGFSSLFRQPHVYIPTGRYPDRSLFRQVVIPTGRFSDRSLFRQVVIPTGRYSDRSIFRQVVIPTGLWGVMMINLFI